MSKNQKVPLSAEKRVILVFVLSALAGVVLVSTALRYLILRTELTQTQTYLESRAGELASRCENEITEAQRDLEFLSKIPAFQHLPYVDRIDRSINGVPENVDVEKRYLLAQLMNKAERFSVLYVLTPNSDIYLLHPFRTQVMITKNNLADRPYYQEAARTKSTVISDSLLGADGILAVVILVPILTNSGDVKAYLGGAFHLSGLSKLVTKERVRPFDAGFLVDRQGYLIAHTDTATLQEGVRERFVQHPLVARFLAKEVGKSGKEPGVDFLDDCVDPLDGKHYMAAFVPLRSGGWGLGLMRDRAAVVAAAQPIVLKIAFLVGLLLMVISGFGVVTAHGIGRNWNNAELALRNSEERFHIAAETANDLVYEWDLKQNIQWFGKIDEILGYEPGGFPRTMDGWAALVHPEDLERVMAEVQVHLEGRGPYASEYRVRRKDGVYRWWSARGAAARAPDGKPVRWVGTVTDITERKRQERELQEKNAELIRFTYTVSHDLKSPLVTVNAFLGYLEQDVRKQDAARMENDFEYIRNATNKMSRLLDELLNLSRVGRIMTPSVEVPLQVIVKEALDLVAGQITQKGVKIQVTEEPILLYGDRPRLVEIFQNLVDNAVKFLGDQPAPRIEIGVEQAGGEMVFFVRDNGIGIDMRHQSKLFDLFEKLNPDMDGTGIGLALVKRIVEVHDGKIWVESEGLSKGTIFRFTLAKTRRQPT